MANPVTDLLDVWKNNSTGVDDNLPQNATPAGDGQTGDLDGELRVLKSEMKGLAERLSWERWKGERNLANTANVAFTYSSGTIFTVNDDFLNANRNVAVVGRRVKAALTGSTIYGTISASSFSSPTTTVTVVWDSGALDATLSEVMFGCELRAIGGLQNIRFSPTAPTLGQLYQYDGSQMVAAAGAPIVLTNKTGGSLAAGDVVALDTANDSAVALADTASTQKQLVVSLDAPANNATGRFAVMGLATVNVGAAVTRGNYLAKSGTTKVALDTGVAEGNTAQIPAGTFAIALTAAGGAGSVVAKLLGFTASAPTIDTSLPGIVNLVAQNNATTPNTQFDFTAEKVYFYNPTDNSTTVKTASLSVTNNISLDNTNANGRDQSAAFSAGSWVHFYYVLTSDGVVRSRSSVSATAPTLASGEIAFVYVGAVRLNASSALVKTYIRGNEAFYQGIQNALLDGAATAETAIDVSAFVPPNATCWTGQFTYGGTNVGDSAEVDLSLRLVTGVDLPSARLGRTTPGKWPIIYTVPNISQQILYIWSAAPHANSDLDVDVLGYVLPNGG